MAVVDASVVLDWVAPGVGAEEPAVAVRTELARRGERVTGPRLLLEEVGNALLTGARRRRWTKADADRAWVLLLELPVALADTPGDLARAWELSRRYDEHPLYDMVYVALAERLGERLITADAALRRRLVGIDWIMAPGDVAPA